MSPDPMSPEPRHRDARNHPATGATPPCIHVVGLGLEGPKSLPPEGRAAIERAQILIGAERHLSHFPTHTAERWPLGNLNTLLARLQPFVTQTDGPQIVILTSGDPLFFGLGRLLLAALPAEQLVFYPNVSAVQLAFSRLQIPWQTARVVSVHGRSGDALSAALRQGESTIAVIGDPQVGPGAIAQIVRSAPYRYRVWCCENLGGPNEVIRAFAPSQLPATVASLHLWVLQRQAPAAPNPSSLPLLGIPDEEFNRFADRPGLMTKRAVRILALAELSLQPQQIVWDIGAGTGSVSIEAARLCPASQIYAVEKTAAGIQLIHQNSQRFKVANVIPIQGDAMTAIAPLPPPHRIFIGGNGGNLNALLATLTQRLDRDGRIVIAAATLDSQASLMNWLAENQSWQSNHLQVNVSQSTQVGPYQRLAPLNPVLLTTLWRPD
ncbi:MAG: precorrin-6y C5,15-methyltransferase (decarboxylating) subunit CbiE [Cyanobacteria bacterium J06629_9]